MSLKARIAALIDAQGPMSVAQFMTISLLDPQQGYYAIRDPLGSGGDFTTAPEISQMFGEMIGLWLVQAWADQGRPKAPRLVELGPGRGTLMADILRTAQVAPDFLADLEVVLIEASPALQQIQADKLRGAGKGIMGADVSWQAQFDDSLADRPLFLVANEFFDALPVRQYVKTERGWCERMVTALDGELAFALAPVPVPPATIPADRERAPDGGVYETSPAGCALAQDIARIIATRGGAALIVDYGYTEVAGFSETLQAVSGHRFADALAEPGEDDISAHVDFAALAQAGRRGGAAVFGPTTQGQFLANIGITERAEQLMKTNPQSAGELLSATERLIGNDQMGRLFKALAFCPSIVTDVAGFAP
ncbi:MAG TPA: SAM-dependent methyltransferase [Rhizomicrobium sp.]|nr:SAM-dependent methyltransferase [Rhizomicrobium sp.]